MKSNQKNDERWMRRALRLAATGLGLSSPNPSVGACIVNNNSLLGEGVHTQCGSDHAEVLAIKHAQQNGADVNGATMYITLAPCTSQGRTPACSDAIRAAGIARVVAALPDPFQDDPALLFQQNGISYESGCLQNIASHLHGGFIKRMQQKMPRITGKWAMTVDGYLSTADGHSKWISNDIALGLSRRRRRVFDAIIVGSGTFNSDNPSLLAQAQRSPKRVIVARKTIPDFSASALLDNKQEVICYHDDSQLERIKSAELAGIRLIHYDSNVGIAAVFESLAIDEACNDVLVEGGAQIHQACLQDQLYDRLEIYVGARTIAGGVPVSGLCGAPTIDDGQRWQLECQPLAYADCICLRYTSTP